MSEFHACLSMCCISAPCADIQEFSGFSECSEGSRAMPTAVPCYEYGPAVHCQRPPHTMSTPPPLSVFGGRMQGKRGYRRRGAGGREEDDGAARGARRLPERDFSLHKISVEKFGQICLREGRRIHPPWMQQDIGVVPTAFCPPARRRGHSLSMPAHARNIPAVLPCEGHPCCLGHT